MNTGVGDADAVAWKLRASLEGWAGSGLLETHDTERRPVAERNCEWSRSNLAAIGRFVGAVARGDREAVAASMSGLDAYVDHPGLDLGPVYASDAIVADASPPPASPDPVRMLVDDGRPGARAPHMWLRDEGRSTLDLYGRDFRLLASTAGWAAAGREAAAHTAAPLGVVDLAGREAPGMPPWDVRHGVGPDGAVLVRPDGHVSWRCPGPVPDPPAVILSALRASCRR